jgi:hypothetical protein
MHSFVSKSGTAPTELIAPRKSSKKVAMLKTTRTIFDSIADRAATTRMAYCRTLLVIGTVACTGCAPSAQSTSLYHLDTPAQSECARPVQWLENAQVTRPYRELARLSATCPSLLPSTCEKILLARGCALGADAIVPLRWTLTTLKPNAVHTTRRPRSIGQVCESLAIRYTAPSEAE